MTLAPGCSGSEQLNERLSLGYKLQKKHDVSSTAELLMLQKELEEKLQAVLNIEETIQQKEKETNHLLAEAKKTAEKITTGRNKQVKTLEDKVNKLLVQVGMPNAKLKVLVQPADLSSSGANAIEFYLMRTVADSFSRYAKWPVVVNSAA